MLLWHGRRVAEDGNNVKEIIPNIFFKHKVYKGKQSSFLIYYSLCVTLWPLCLNYFFITKIPAFAWKAYKTCVYLCSSVVFKMDCRVANVPSNDDFGGIFASSNFRYKD